MIKPYFETGLGKLYHGDCLEIMREMEDESVDMGLTDLPYNLNKKYGPEYNDNRDEKEYWEWFEEIFSQIFRLLGNGFIYISHSDKGVYEAKPILEKIGFTYIQTLIWWGKNGYSRQLHRKKWSYRHEPILFMSKGSPQYLEAGIKGMWYTSVLDVPRPQSNFKEGRYHPTQKPIKLYQNIIQRTPSNIVLDPCFGSGTSGIACEILNRRWIGIEISKEYCDIAVERIKKEIAQYKLSI